MNQRTLLLSAVAGFVLVNGGAYLVVKSLKAPPAASPAAGDELARRRRDQEEGHRRRAAGLAALEAADYEKALINLTEAKVLLGDQASVDQLLKVTEDLRARGPRPPEPAAAAAPTGAAPGPTAAPVPTAAATPAEEPARKAAAPRPAPAGPPPAAPAPARTATVARAPAPARETAEPRAAEPAPRTGLLLVTTTPRGVLVQVDGAAVDLTPMRVSLRPGTHRVVLLDGERHLHEAQVEVVEGQVTTVLRDVSAELAQGRAEAAPAPSRPPPAPEAAPEPARPAEERAPAAAVGGLDVTSPGLYAELWINGRSYGFPPVSARQLPAGPARIEARVNGAVKRRAEVEVVAGQVQQVKVR